MVLSDLKTGRAVICLPPDGNKLSRRLLDMGFSDGMPVERLCRNPGGTLWAFRIQDSIIALRQDELKQIKINKTVR